MIVHSTDEDLLAAGASPYYLGTGWMWFNRVNGEYDYSRIDISAVDRSLKHIVDAGDWSANKPLMMDIEAFDLVKDRENAIKQLRTAAMRVKSFQPNFPIGFYRLIPERNYWTPVTGNYLDVQRWQRRNDANAVDLLSLVDIVFPSVYAFYPGKETEWLTYVEANLEEACRVGRGKQVLPVLMPRYRGTSAIELDKWAMMVEFVSAYPGIDGLAIHSSPDYVVDPQWRVPVTELLRRDPDTGMPPPSGPGGG